MYDAARELITTTNQVFNITSFRDIIGASTSPPTTAAVRGKGVMMIADIIKQQQHHQCVATIRGQCHQMRPDYVTNASVTQAAGYCQEHDTFSS